MTWTETLEADLSIERFPTERLPIIQVPSAVITVPWSVDDQELARMRHAYQQAQGQGPSADAWSAQWEKAERRRKLGELISTLAYGVVAGLLVVMVVAIVLVAKEMDSKPTWPAPTSTTVTMLDAVLPSVPLVNGGVGTASTQGEGSTTRGVPTTKGVPEPRGTQQGGTPLVPPTGTQVSATTVAQPVTTVVATTMGVPPTGTQGEGVPSTTQGVPATDPSTTNPANEPPHTTTTTQGSTTTASTTSVGV